MGVFAKAQTALLALSAVYVTFIASLATPYLQSHAVFLHKVRWPLFADLSDPVQYGLPVGRTVNLRITTKDNVELGAWLVLPPSAVQSSPFTGSPSDETIGYSIKSHPTVLFFHGNAATRATGSRIQHCLAYASRFDANVLAIDYRGFADSDGFPTPEGLIKDARAAWDWTVERGAKPGDIFLVGLSLGTGVVSGLAAELQTANIRPRGITLLAPFTSIKELLLDYSLFGLIPILQPLQMFPPVQKFISSFLSVDFETQQVLPSVKAPILIVHSSNDMDIPISHSESLFETFVSPQLPPVPKAPSSATEAHSFDWAAHKAASALRNEEYAKLVDKKDIPGFAKVHSFKDSLDKERGEVTFVEAQWGGHNGIGVQESLVDLMAAMFFPRVA